MIPNAGGFLFKIHGLVSKELFRVNHMDPLSSLHQIFRNLLVGGEVAAVAREESSETVRCVTADQKVGHRLVIVKVLSAQRTLELYPQEAKPSVTRFSLRPLSLDGYPPRILVEGQVPSQKN